MRRAALVFVVAVTACSSNGSGRSVRVAAAADLARAFVEVAKDFEAKTGVVAHIDFGSSGLLAKQIEQG
ncbi:MAG TPA: substrate-binding domain-containing protein, partial [Kofleriaceae bacterium]|nr:substrate-binding domain-containing protein [Kofleriaceae bacterium]